jgi:Tfp pilus assembly PilM family ATPase
MGLMERISGSLREKVQTDIVGLDFGSSGIKAVRMRRTKDGIVVSAADILPRADPPHGPLRLNLPVPLVAKYAAICIGTPRSTIRLLEIPLSPDRSPEEQIQQQFNLTGDYRMGHFPLTTLGAKGFLKTVAVAIEEETVRHVLDQLATGLPAPHSLELSGLAALNAYLDHGVDGNPEEVVALIEGGARNVYLFILHRDRPVLIRKFDVGAATIAEQIRSQFELDAATAENALMTGAIDLSGVIRETMGEFLRQLVISKDYAEREENSRIRRVVLTGGLSRNEFWSRAISETLRLKAEAWNPFAGLSMAPGAYPERWRGHEGRWAAAIGAACGGLRTS